MRVIVFSSLAGETAGYAAFNVSSRFLVGELLKLYCYEKGAKVSSDYILCGKGNVVLDPEKTLEEEGIKDGDYVSLCVDEIKGQLYEFGSWCMISSIALGLGLIGLIYAVIFYTTTGVAELKYGLVVDAGSSHSQLLVFSWSHLPEHEMEKLALVHSCFMPGGIAEFRTRPRDLFSYFGTCLEEAKAVVPVSAHHETPLILAATGGMRILQAYDPQGAELVLLAIRMVFSSTTGFLTRYEYVFVASGEQEGISGWTALNYLMQNFQENENQSEAQVSALDLGGASFQVTTELPGDETKWPTINITLFNNTYSVYSKSFLCYGIGAAMHRYWSLLLLNSRSDATHAYNPCLPKGLNATITSEDLFDPCILSNKSQRVRFQFPNKFSNAYVNKYILQRSVLPSYGMNESNASGAEESPDSGKTVFVLRGSSDPQRCEKEVRKLFDYNLCRKNFVLGDCLNRKLIPPYKGELVGFSSIFHKLLPLLGVGKEEGPEKLKIAVLEVCSMSAQNLREKHPNLTRDMIQDICFDGMYIYNLLHYGLGVTQWKNILFTSKVREQDVVWAMGLILNRTSNAVAPKTYHFKKVAFYFQVATFSVFIIVGFIFLVYFYKLKQRGNVYQRVQMIVF